MDGVLVDGEPLHFRAVNQLLATAGQSISLERYKPYMGTKTGWSDMLKDYDLPRPEEYYSARYGEIMIEAYRRQAEALPGALAAVEGTRSAGLPVALASSSIRPWVEACLDRIGLRSAFAAVVTGSDVTAGKPDPEIYTLAAERLGAPPERCLAIEDAPAGIESAHRAGMTCWAVRTEYTRDLILPDPERELESLVEFDVDQVVGAAA